MTETPWIRGGVVFSRECWDELLRDVLARYERDEEACGYVSGPQSEPLRCTETTALANLANKLHAYDPETYFRTARTFFAFNEKLFDDAVSRGEASGQPVKVLYHSHLDAGAYFSPTDIAVLSCGEPPSREGELGKPGPGPGWPLAFLVVSVTREGLEPPRIAEHRLYVWTGVGFEPAPFSVEA